MRVTIDLMKKSTQIIDLSNVINPRVGDDDLLLPLHIVYDDNQTDMRGKDVEFLSNDTNKKRIYVAGTCNTNTPGDNLYMGNLTFRFPAGTFKADGTYDPDKTMFRIVDKATNKVISSVNVKITVMKNSIEFDFDPDNTSYDSRLEEMLHGFHDKGQAMLDDIKDLNDQAKSNVSGDTAATAKEAKQQADANADDISDLKGEVAGARGRFADMAGREDAQDAAINQKESIVNANANYAALQQKNAKLEGRQTALSLEYQSKLAQINVNPEFATDINELTAKYPNGKEGVFILNNGHTAIYQNGWQDSGHSITVGSFNYRAFIGITDVTAPYDSLDTLPANSVIFYAPDVTQKFLELPFTDNHVSIAVITAGANFDSQNNYGRVQRLINRYTGNEYYRTVWVGSDGQLKWDNWYSQKGMQELAFTGEPLSDPYDDLNTLPSNTIAFYAPLKSLKNNPLNEAIVVKTEGPNIVTSSNYGKVQTVIGQYSGKKYHRTVWIDGSGTGEWGIWTSSDGMQELAFTGEPLSDPYDDLNTLPSNTIAFYAPLKSLKNNPLNEAIVVKTEGPTFMTGVNINGHD
ncbi:BppU family phage baseplate upper protein [Limosilactobacillus reuteri]|uniref:BppU family phage baseplate upper protein n=1 Tax=Limosilactobacillus reuteri TaxID=1598 RepID=UPI003D76CD0B